MIWRGLAMMLAATPLTGCSFDYEIYAGFIDGELHFYGAKNDWFAGRTGFCPSYVTLRTSRGKTVWRIEKVTPGVQCELFPLAYGATPIEWKTVVPATPLQVGETYIFNADGGDAYHGAFRYGERRQLTVENEPELARNLPYPGYNWNEQAANEPAD